MQPNLTMTYKMCCVIVGRQIFFIISLTSTRYKTKHINFWIDGDGEKRAIEMKILAYFY